MIQSNELRIGNWINYKGEPLTVTMIGLYGIQYDVDGGIINAKFSTPDLTPIPLTPSILEKCGFGKINHLIEGILYKKDWLFCNERMTGFNWRGGYISNAPKYLHQLQNLYFALTGTELEVKL